MTPEKIVQNSLIVYMKKLQTKGVPLYFERRQAGGISYKDGIADLYAVLNGVHVEIEVKKKGGHMSPLQEKWRDACQRYNIKWICCDNVDDLDALFKSIYKF